MASNAATRKVQPINRRTTTVRSSTVNDLELGCHKSVLFYAFVEPKQHKRKIVLDYLDPPVHDESVLLNENMSPADFVLPYYHLLSQEERDTCIDSSMFITISFIG